MLALLGLTSVMVVDMLNGEAESDRFDFERERRG
jgi:hypothetical protein